MSFPLSDRYGTMLYRAYVQERPKRTPLKTQEAEFRGGKTDLPPELGLQMSVRPGIWGSWQTFLTYKIPETNSKSP